MSWSECANKTTFKLSKDKNKKAFKQDSAEFYYFC